MAHRIAIVGFGGIARAHVAGYRQVLGAGVEIAAVVDPDPERRRLAREEYGIEAAYGSLDPVLADPEIAFATVATPPDVRSQVVRPLLAAGKHVLVEKPFTWRLPEARALVAAAEASDGLLAVNQNFRYNSLALNTTAWRLR